MFVWQASWPGAGAAFTDGSVNVADPSGPGQAAVAEALGLGRIVTLTQVHGADVVHVDEEFLRSHGPQQPRPRADAMVTSLRLDPPVALCVRAADCMPVVLVDAAAQVAGAAHAGRVGFDAGVLGAVVAAMRDLGAANITAWIGPHICGGCYEVPAEMAADFAARKPGTRSTTTWGTPALDLGAGAEDELRALGCATARAGGCTLQDPSLPSYRRDGDRSGRLGGLVWLR